MDVTMVSLRRYRSQICWTIGTMVFIVVTAEFIVRRQTEDNRVNQPAKTDPVKEASIKAAEASGKTVYSQEPFGTDFLFESINGIIHDDPAIRKNATAANAIFKVILTKGREKKLWVAYLKPPEAKIYAPTVDEGLVADCQVTLVDEDLSKMVTGQLRVQAAFLAGRIKLAGNVLRAAKLKALISRDVLMKYKDLLGVKV